MAGIAIFFEEKFFIVCEKHSVAEVEDEIGIVGDLLNFADKLRDFLKFKCLLFLCLVIGAEKEEYTDGN